MDQDLCALFARNLNLDADSVKSAYIKALSEFLSGNQVETGLPSTPPAPKAYCVYKFITGVNAGKQCGLLQKNANANAAFRIDDKNYCAAHYKTITEKRNKSEKLKLAGINQSFVTFQKVETEPMGSFVVAKGTLLIIDKDKSVCKGKLVKGEPTHKISMEDEKLLKETNIPYYDCEVEDVAVDDL